MDQNGAVSFSRNGQFHLDKNGYIINDQTLKLTGYPASASGLITATCATTTGARPSSWRKAAEPVQSL